MATDKCLADRLLWLLAKELASLPTMDDYYNSDWIMGLDFSRAGLRYHAAEEVLGYDVVMEEVRRAGWAFIDFPVNFMNRDWEAALDGR